MLTAFTSSGLNPTNAPSAQIRLATTSPKSQPSSLEGTQLTDFSQISASGQDVIHIPRSYFTIWGFYFDLSE